MTCTTALIVDYWQDEARRRVLGLRVPRWESAGWCFRCSGALATAGWRGAGYLLVSLIMLAAVSLKDVPRVRNPAGDGVARFPGDLPLRFSSGVIRHDRDVCDTVARGFSAQGARLPVAARLALGIALPSPFASLASFLAWMLQKRMSALAIVVLTFLSITLGYGIVASATSLYGVFVGLAFCGAGFGLTRQSDRWLQQTVPAEMRGRAAGGFATAVFLGQFLATFVFAYLARVTDFAGTFTAVALASAAVALSALVTKVAFGMASIGVITKPDGRAVLENQVARRVE